MRFGGLIVGGVSSGEECSTSDIYFKASAATESDILTWNGLLQTTLIGVAEVHHGHGELYVDSEGRCYGLSLIHDAFYFEGETFVQAVERILRGRRSRAMLRPDQKSVDLYGITYTADHPDVYNYG